MGDSFNPLRTEALQVMRKRNNDDPVKYDDLNQLLQDFERRYRGQMENASRDAENIPETSNDPSSEAVAPKNNSKPRVVRVSLGKSRMPFGGDSSRTSNTTKRPNMSFSPKRLAEPPLNKSRLDTASRRIPRNLSANASRTHANQTEREPEDPGGNAHTSNNNVVFYNESMQTLDVIKGVSEIKERVAARFKKSEVARAHMIQGVINEFNNDLCRAKEKKLRYWFILEQPFHNWSDETFEKGHALISRIPMKFRIDLLPDVIGKLDIRGSGVTHVVLNINSNWLTYYDTQGVNDRKKYKELIYDLMKMFRGASVKKMVILTVPLPPSYQLSATNIERVIHQEVIELGKGTSEKFVVFEDYNHVIRQKGLAHGSDGLRVMLHRLNNHFRVE